MLKTFLDQRRKRILDNRYALHRDELARRRGHIVHTWAAIESCIDQANHAGWRLSDRTLSREVPIGFTRKIELFKKIHRDGQLLAELREQASDLLESLKPMLDDRNRLVHGFNLIENWTLDGWAVCRFIFTPNGLEEEETFYTRDELERIDRQLGDVLTKAAHYIMAITGKLDEHLANDGDG